MVITFKSVDNVNSFNEYEYKPEKFSINFSQITNSVVKSLINFNTVRAVAYCVSLYQLRKKANKYNSNLALED